MNFSYVEVEDVAPLIPGGLPEAKREMLENHLVLLSSRLSGWFAGLRQAFAEEEQLVLNGQATHSDLVNLVKAMVIGGGRKFILNPEGHASENIGVFAYSKFDSADPLKYAFEDQDLAALKRLLEAAREEQVGSFRLPSAYHMYPANPTPAPGVYTTSRRYKDWRR